MGEHGNHLRRNKYNKIKKFRFTSKQNTVSITSMQTTPISFAGRVPIYTNCERDEVNHIYGVGVVGGVDDQYAKFQSF
jgi:hypothetical protein